MSAAVLALALPLTAGAAELVLIGTHASGPGRGFSLARFDEATGALGVPRLDCEADAPSYFVVAPGGARLYACNSVPDGGVSAYTLDPATGRVAFLNRRPSGGAEPCYVSLDRAARHLLVVNYNSGSLAVFALRPDGGIGERTAFARHTGHSVNPDRQASAHTHSIVVDPTDRFVLCSDLGEDRVYVYRFDDRSGSLAPNDPPFVAVQPGLGPRHLAFHPNGRWVYLTAEMGNAVLGFDWDSAGGTLRPFQEISTLPAGFQGVSTAAEIAIHPSGRFLCATNRGADTVAVFSIDPRDGHLAPRQSISTEGHMPRNMIFDPTGRWLLVTNHDGNNALVFRFDPETGELAPAGPPAPTTFPFGLRFVGADSGGT